MRRLGLSLRDIERDTGRSRSAVARDITVGEAELAERRSEIALDREAAKRGQPTPAPKANWAVYVADPRRQQIITPSGAPAPGHRRLRSPGEFANPSDVIRYEREQERRAVEENRAAGFSRDGFAQYVLPNGDRGNYDPYDDVALIERIRGWFAEQGVSDWQPHPGSAP